MQIGRGTRQTEHATVAQGVVTVEEASTSSARLQEAEAARQQAGGVTSNNVELKYGAAWDCGEGRDAQ